MAALTRRHCLLACAGLGVAATVPRAIADDGAEFRIPGEFEPMEAVWLGYDAGHVEFTRALLGALWPHVSVKLLVADAAARQEAEALLRQAGQGRTRTELHVDPMAMYFLRDAAVFTLGPRGDLGVIDFVWTQYGLPGWCRRRYAADQDLAMQCDEGVDLRRDELDRSIAALARAQLFSSRLAMEGGGVECNGQGLLLANQALWMQRNPQFTKAQLEHELLKLPGVTKVLWLPEGLAQDPLHRSTIVGPYVSWGTGGHTDEFVRFADARTVLLAWPEHVDANSHPVARLNRQRMQRCLEVLSRSTDAEGRPLRVLKVPLPRIVERRIFLSAGADTRFSAEWSADAFPADERRRQGDAVMQVASTSYLNFVVANGVVVVPSYLEHGTTVRTQERVRRIFEEAFPGRQIVFIDAIGANWVGGGPHCATLSEPRRTGSNSAADAD